ncbi:hypothetical protein OF377_00295 [Ureaplasma sp. ES3154-GEN]|uniref:Vmc-like lipoprotein signal peptide domain-containing protein n=1 Tax=Ureaplasma sp. ES3154-GEN TaxID=2984844 RepID=UPI0021E95F5A|nr:hypothetical protein [Ureaplasma sp. ES3154-GEN]MCV3743327.1 hypothetical protein [Ureaplasma sp. ES3154-GEN]
MKKLHKKLIFMILSGTSLLGTIAAIAASCKSEKQEKLIKQTNPNTKNSKDEAPNNNSTPQPQPTPSDESKTKKPDVTLSLDPETNSETKSEVKLEQQQEQKQESEKRSPSPEQPETHNNQNNDKHMNQESNQNNGNQPELAPEESKPNNKTMDNQEMYDSQMFISFTSQNANIVDLFENQPTLYSVLISNDIVQENLKVEGYYLITNLFDNITGEPILSFYSSTEDIKDKRPIDGYTFVDFKFEKAKLENISSFDVVGIKYVGGSKKDNSQSNQEHVIKFQNPLVIQVRKTNSDGVSELRNNNYLALENVIKTRAQNYLEAHNEIVKIVDEIHDKKQQTTLRDQWIAAYNNLQEAFTNISSSNTFNEDLFIKLYEATVDYEQKPLKVRYQNLLEQLNNLLTEVNAKSDTEPKYKEIKATLENALNEVQQKINQESWNTDYKNAIEKLTEILGNVN